MSRPIIRPVGSEHTSHLKNKIVHYVVVGFNVITSKSSLHAPYFVYCTCMYKT